MPSCKPEDGYRAEAAGGDLHRSKCEWGRRESPEGRKQHEDRIDVAPQPDHLLPRGVRNLEWAAVGRAPDSLHHVAEVEARQLELEIRGTHDPEECERPTDHRRPDHERPRVLADERRDVRAVGAHGQLRAHDVPTVKKGSVMVFANRVSDGSCNIICKRSSSPIRG